MKSFSELLKQFPFPTFLAPMEEVTDYSFRTICKSFGVNFLTSEFISSDALIRDAEKSMKKLYFTEAERPFGIQIFGNDEHSLTQAAIIAETRDPDFIEINWGCPVKKIVVKGCGSAILKDIPKMVRLTKAVVEAVKLPVTVKTRLGWEENDKPIVSVAEQLQDIGIQGITIHGRTRSQIYSGPADWQLIGETVNHPRLTIPVIGNGDINSAEKAIRYKNDYGVAGIMIGRAAIGNPWIFKDINDLLNHRAPNTPTYDERVEICLLHLQKAIDWKGERLAILEMRRHYAHYFRGIYAFKEKKIKLMDAKTYEECKAILSH